MEKDISPRKFYISLHDVLNYFSFEFFVFVIIITDGVLSNYTWLYSSLNLHDIYLL